MIHLVLVKIPHEIYGVDVVEVGGESQLEGEETAVGVLALLGDDADEQVVGEDVGEAAGIDAVADLDAHVLGDVVEVGGCGVAEFPGDRAQLVGGHHLGADVAVRVQQRGDGGEVGGHVGDHAHDAVGGEHGHVANDAVGRTLVDHQVVVFAVDGVIDHVGAGVVVQAGAGGAVGERVGDDALRRADGVAADQEVGLLVAHQPQVLGHEGFVFGAVVEMAYDVVPHPVEGSDEGACRIPDGNPLVGRGLVDHHDARDEQHGEDDHVEVLADESEQFSHRAGEGLASGGGELLQEAGVVLEVEADVVGLVLEHGHALDAESEGEAGVLLAVDAAVLEHVGIDHAAAEDLDPAGVLAERAALAAADVARHVHLRRRLGEGEEGGAQADAGLLAEELLGEVEQRLLHVGEGDVLVDIQAFHLVEDAVGAGGDDLVAEDTARADDADGRLPFLHGAHLQRGSVRAQGDVGLLLDEEGVLHVAGGVLLREVERREDVPVVLDVGTIDGGEADLLEDAAHLVHHQGDGVAGTQGLGRGRTGDVDLALLDGSGLLQSLALLVEIGLGLLFQQVDLLSESLALFGGHVLDLTEQRLQFALLVQELRTETFEVFRRVDLEIL